MDAARRPAELLAFAQVKRGMQVLEDVAAGGYTSQLLALAVEPSGAVWAQRASAGAAIPTDQFALRLVKP